MQELDKQAKQILLDNDMGGYTLPSKGLYPFQWNWDSAFAAWGFASFDVARAWDELDMLFASQWESGMVPHIIFHREEGDYFPGSDQWKTGRMPATSGISQPPVVAILAKLIFEIDPQLGRERLESLYPKILKWHAWWQRERCTLGPAAIVHPWESGRDNCPDWDIGMADVDTTNVGTFQRRDTSHVDPSMRPTEDEYRRYMAIVAYGAEVNWDDQKMREACPFYMADPGMTFILLKAHEDLADLGRSLGQDVAMIEKWADGLRNAVADLWNENIQAYDAKNLRTSQFANVLGSGAFLAYLANAGNAKLDAQLIRVWDKVNYGIPSADPEVAAFNPKKYWRGPSWPFINALIAMGMKEAGRLDWAERLRAETESLIEKHGFYEYYDPIDATPCGGDNFTWTAAVWLAWVRHAPVASNVKGAA